MQEEGRLLEGKPPMRQVRRVLEGYPIMQQEGRLLEESCPMQQDRLMLKGNPTKAAEGTGAGREPSNATGEMSGGSYPSNSFGR